MATRHSRLTSFQFAGPTRKREPGPTYKISEKGSDWSCANHGPITEREDTMLDEAWISCPSLML